MKLLLIFILCVTNLALNAQTTGIVLWHKLDAISSAMITDCSYNNFNGTVFNSPSVVSGQCSNSVSFIGASAQYINCGNLNNILQATNHFTISVWFKRASLGSFLCAGQDNGSFHQNQIRLTSDSRVYFLLDSVASRVYAYYSIDDTNWHLYTMVYDGTLSTDALRLKGYVDGVAVTLSFDGNVIPTSTPVSAINNGSFLINKTLSENLYGTGNIDDVRVYGISLTAGQVSTLYSSGCSDACLSSGSGSTNTIYVTQVGNLPNTNSIAELNAGSLLLPGDTVHLIGTFVSPLTIVNSGTVGHPITLYLDVGAKFSKTNWNETAIKSTTTIHDFNIIGHGGVCIESTTNAKNSDTNNSNGIDMVIGSNFSMSGVVITNLLRWSYGGTPALGFIQDAITQTNHNYSSQGTWSLTNGGVIAVNDRDYALFPGANDTQYSVDGVTYSSYGSIGQATYAWMGNTSPGRTNIFFKGTANQPITVKIYTFSTPSCNGITLRASTGATNDVIHNCAVYYAFNGIAVIFAKDQNGFLIYSNKVANVNQAINYSKDGTSGHQYGIRITANNLTLGSTFDGTGGSHQYEASLHADVIFDNSSQPDGAGPTNHNMIVERNFMRSGGIANMSGIINLTPNNPLTGYPDYSIQNNIIIIDPPTISAPTTLLSYGIQDLVSNSRIINNSIFCISGVGTIGYNFNNSNIISGNLVYCPSVIANQTTDWVRGQSPYVQTSSNLVSFPYYPRYGTNFWPATNHWITLLLGFLGNDYYMPAPLLNGSIVVSNTYYTTNLTSIDYNEQMLGAYNVSAKWLNWINNWHYDAGSTSTNAVLIDFNSYTLQTNSSAGISSAPNMYALGVTNDFDDNPRTASGNWHAGAKANLSDGSAPADLAPTITSQPSSMVGLTNTTLTSSISVVGAASLYYIWYIPTNGIPLIKGVNVSSFSSNSPVARTVYVGCIITNSVGSVVSSYASLIWTNGITPLYTLTVDGITSSKAAGVSVVVTCTNAGRFLYWTNNAGILVDANACSTFFTMPAADAVVNSIYREAPYSLTVVKGNGSGSYTNGEVVSISCTNASLFNDITVSTSAVATASCSTTFLMTNANATVTFSYTNSTPPPPSPSYYVTNAVNVRTITILR